MWSFLQGVRARRAGFAVLAAAALVWAAPASAQVVACPPGTLPPITSCSVSTTHHETDTPVAGTAITAPEPLQTQLNQVFAGPNGAAVQAQLNALGVLGPPGPGAKVSLGTTTTVTDALHSWPRHRLYWPRPNTALFMSIAGDVNFNTNTAFESFFELFSGSQALTNKGINWLSGDLYAAVQTLLLDDGFHFADLLLGQLRGGGFGAASSGALPFAPTATAFGPISRCRTRRSAYAGGMPTKAQKMSAAAYRGNGWSAWVAGSGTFARVDGNDDNFGFGYRSASFAGGMEKQAGLWLYGGAFSIGHSKLTQD